MRRARRKRPSCAAFVVILVILFLAFLIYRYFEQREMIDEVVEDQQEEVVIEDEKEDIVEEEVENVEEEEELEEEDTEDSDTEEDADEEETADDEKNEDEAEEQEGEELLPEDDEVEPYGSYNYLMPDEWEHSDRALKLVDVIEPGQKLEYGIMPHPILENIFFFSTSVFNSDDQTNFISVYEYDTDTYEWERLYRASYGAGQFGLGNMDSHVIPVFHVLGFDPAKDDSDSARLIVLVQDIGDSPGECVQPLLLDQNDTDPGIRAIVAMPLDNPYGLSNFKLPNRVINEAQKQQDKCE